jgi:putative MATE family efflux protein
MVLEMIMESLFAVADVFWVGHLGADAVAVVGLTESLMVLVYTLAIGLSIGATAMVARRIGEKDAEGAARTTLQALFLGLAISLGLGVLGASSAPWLLARMGATPSVIASGTGFARVMLGGSVTAFMLFTVNAAYRGAGDAAIAMRVLWLANGINIVLGPMFIFGVGPFPRMGVTGAALATTLGRGIGLVYALWLLFRGQNRIPMQWVSWRPNREIMARMLRLGANGTFQVLVGNLSWILLVRRMADFGSIAMAGYTIAVRLMMFAILPAWGLSNAAATLVGQSLGASDPDRAEAAVWCSARYNLWFLGSMGLLFFILAPVIVHAFTPDPSVASVAVFGLRATTVGFPFFAFGMVLTQSFNGAGDTATPTWINIGVFWFFELPFAWWISSHGSLGYKGIFLAISMAYSALALVSALLFRRGTWRTRSV